MSKKQPLWFFNFKFQKLCQNIIKKNYISGIFWAFKSKLLIIHAATYIPVFLSHSNNCFFICLVSYIPICLCYFLILCFYFHLLSFSSHHETHSTIYNVWFNFITTYPQYHRDKKYFIVHYQRKTFALIITNPML